MTIVNAISTFLTDHIVDIGIIAAVYISGRIFLSVLGHRVKKYAQDPNGNRRRKIVHLIHDAGNTVLFLIIAFWILRMIGIDPTPLLASAGVVGLAIGFGAQTLVKDFIAGAFIIAENQYGVGDTVSLNGFEGTVECFSIRSTVLRDAEGNKIFIPNGSIGPVVNRSDKPKVC